jgi:acetolactate synthase regulatory subunit
VIVQLNFLWFSIAKSLNGKIAKSGSRGTTMQVFHIRYRNAQGALMRILNAASRRGLDLTSVHAEAAEQDHAVTLLLEVNQKQIGQLYREWYGIVDVTDVRSSAAFRDHEEAAWAPHPPTSQTAAQTSARAALA